MVKGNTHYYQPDTFTGQNPFNEKVNTDCTDREYKLEMKVLQLQSQIDEVKDFCEIHIDDKFDVFSSEQLRKILNILSKLEEVGK